MPADLAIGVVLSLLLDEGDADAQRGEARDKVLDLLDTPLDEAEAQAWRRERWGVSNRREVEATERAIEGADGDFADVDLDELRARMEAQA